MDSTPNYTRFRPPPTGEIMQTPLTPLEFAGIVHEPAIAGDVADFTHAYLRLRYGGQRDAASKMFAIIDRLSRPGRRQKTRGLNQLD